MTAFEKELIEFLAKETEWGEDEVLIEVLCRKLYKHGLIKRTDDVWILEAEETHGQRL